MTQQPRVNLKMKKIIAIVLASAALFYYVVLSDAKPTVRAFLKNVQVRNILLLF